MLDILHQFQARLARIESMENDQLCFQADRYCGSEAMRIPFSTLNAPNDSAYGPSVEVKSRADELKGCSSPHNTPIIQTEIENEVKRKEEYACPRGSLVNAVFDRDRLLLSVPGRYAEDSERIQSSVPEEETVDLNIRLTAYQEYTTTKVTSHNITWGIKKMVLSLLSVENQGCNSLCVGLPSDY